ncbi:5'-nucleotidase, lipoprotein e(P4) family [Stakelama tenebrarum]|uniref:Acid phosphatase n=1 Tax=Stakelama tenebrarum TaxID=2711215 RepID=A0A6G6Y8F1_9SPHN|nr:HAD family acid phosphatase [Sphingosinithalassobacter tenebrarum]QIG81205.1 acid phosphatase [Sphingosinithalassobacter tenebrarum]
MSRALAALGISLALAGCVSGADRAVPEPVSAAPALPPETMRWLYGSGEAAALSIQTFRWIADYALANGGADARSVILAPGATPRAPSFTDCGEKPRAVVFDVDETLLLNLGYEYWQASTGSGYDSAVWDEWERTGTQAVAPVPGAVTALRRIRAGGMTVVFNTNRQAANAEGTIAALDHAGLGPAVHGETLFLKGDDAMGSAKDGRRATIAARYCVVAMAGDNLGDFSDRFNDADLAADARRRMAGSGASAQGLWGMGWFVLPNPVYGASLKGDFDSVFPADVRWMPEAGGD